MRYPLTLDSVAGFGILPSRLAGRSGVRAMIASNGYPLICADGERSSVPFPVAAGNWYRYLTIQHAPHE
jgi:hypothetical protein